MRMTVRQLLKLFGAKRRGKEVTADIQAQLSKHGLRTEPDFADALDIDSKVTIWGTPVPSAGDEVVHIDNIAEVVTDLRDRVAALEATKRLG